MSISAEINRITADKNKIRTKLVELGMATSSDNLDKLATAIEGIIDNGAVSVNVKEGEIYTIPRGYHNGSGTVSGTKGGGNYTLQAKTVTPTKKQQSVTPSEGYYGLSAVTVNAIPETYQDTSSVTATAADVLTGKIFVSSTGDIITGSMINNGAVSKTLTGTTVSYTIPKGYHDGKGTVKITLETKTVTPTKATQNITAGNGKVLGKVVVNPIPSNYITTTDANATADNIEYGKTAYVNGSKITGNVEAKGTGSSGEAIGLGDTFNFSFDNYSQPAGGETLHGVQIKLNSLTNKTIINPNSKFIYGFATPNSKYFGNATAEDVASGKTFTASTGYKILGTNTKDADTSDANALAGDIVSGKTAYVKGKKVTGTFNGVSTADATATANDIAKGKTAYVNGQKVTGTIDEYRAPVGFQNEDRTSLSYTTSKDGRLQSINVDTRNNADCIIRKSCTFSVLVTNLTLFGDATANEVLVGNTFTSSSGLKAAGTMPNNGSSTKSMDGLTTTTVSIPAGYTTGGTISLTNDIETMLAGI